MTTASSPPLVLCISGHDPGGGAGLQADIEAVGAQGAHAMGVITALTVQDTRNVRRVEPVAIDIFADQLELLLADSRIAAIKLGLLGSTAQVPVILDAIARCRAPVVLDPVLRAGGGGTLAADATARAIADRLLPAATIATPNADEARRLSGEPTPAAAAARLLATGCEQLLITGGDEATTEVENRWYHRDGREILFRWPRLPQGFHGAGCTLASALAARLALGEAMNVALDRAQRYVHTCLERALQPGRGRAIPGRWPR
ncbi:MAG: bifunctional hydroxymethylpyrimidine kinase/phosphomethylpyrimidine kinase [Sinimarinibacterium flocculans]|uniref:bifunctional hydroxymethylpyrimidine kinase/phosphomethylpyrimidine kinase n=1 Tax=Sinimarinibacterium flocculans TaxID=985250 RepID=UPI003C426DAE